MNRNLKSRASAPTPQRMINRKSGRLFCAFLTGGGDATTLLFSLSCWTFFRASEIKLILYFLFSSECFKGKRWQKNSSSLKNRDYQTVIEQTTTLLETYPRDSALFTYRGLGYFHLRQYQQASENFQHSLQLSSSGFENYYYLGLIADNSGNFEQAVQFYRRFLEMAKDESKFSRHVRWAGERIKLIEKNLGGE